MAANNSLIGGESSIHLSNRVILVQVFVSVFLSINLCLTTTFFMKDFFYRTMRYILFAVTLLFDCLFLIITDLLLIFAYFRFTIQVWLCLVISTVSSLYTFVTAVTLTAMTLERYVAICMPLRHAELCSTHRSLQCILIIHGLSSVPATAILFVFFASATHSLYSQTRICFIESIMLYSWQNQLRSAICQFYFLVMCIIIVFSYVKIMKVARTASGENKKSSWKGLRTVALHAFQLLLSFIQLWCPFTEAAVLKINVTLYIDVRYFNYITFILAPRCLSPLIYGLRDEMFFHVLKCYALCGLYRKQPSHLS